MDKKINSRVMNPKCKLSASVPKTKPAQAQKGVALIVAILVVAIVTSISVTVISNNYLTTKRVYRQINNEQGQSYLKAVETLAIKILKQDLENDVSLAKEIFDGCSDIWATPFEAVTYNDEGVYGGFISDLGGRFNLNSLISSPTVTAANTSGIPPLNVPQARFMRLLQSFVDLDESVELTPEQSQRITAALIDWIDPDSNVTSNLGAEESFYQGIGIDAKPPNGPMLNVSELIVILQVLEDPTLAANLYELLAPRVTVWPQVGGGNININTTSAEMLRSLNVVAGSLTGSPASVYNLQQLRDRLTPPYRSYNDITTVVAQAYKDIGSDPDFSGVTVNSNFFELTSYVKLGDLSTRMYTVFERSFDQATQKATVKVLSRSRNGFFLACEQ